MDVNFWKYQETWQNTVRERPINRSHDVQRQINISQDVPLQRGTAAAGSLCHSIHSQAQTSQSARPPTVLESSHCILGDSGSVGRGGN